MPQGDPGRSGKDGLPGIPGFKVNTNTYSYVSWVENNWELKQYMLLEMLKFTVVTGQTSLISVGLWTGTVVLRVIIRDLLILGASPSSAKNGNNTTTLSRLFCHGLSLWWKKYHSYLQHEMALHCLYVTTESSSNWLFRVIQLLTLNCWDHS